LVWNGGEKSFKFTNLFIPVSSHYLLAVCTSG